jgi:hypothetical protein
MLFAVPLLAVRPLRALSLTLLWWPLGPVPSFGHACTRCLDVDHLSCWPGKRAESFYVVLYLHLLLLTLNTEYVPPPFPKQMQMAWMTWEATSFEHRYVPFSFTTGVPLSWCLLPQLIRLVRVLGLLLLWGHSALCLASTVHAPLARIPPTNITRWTHPP